MSSSVLESKFLMEGKILSPNLFALEINFPKELLAAEIHPLVLVIAGLSSFSSNNFKFLYVDLNIRSLSQRKALKESDCFSFKWLITSVKKCFIFLILSLMKSDL